MRSLLAGTAVLATAFVLVVSSPDAAQAQSQCQAVRTQANALVERWAQSLAALSRAQQDAAAAQQALDRESGAIDALAREPSDSAYDIVATTLEAAPRLQAYRAAYDVLAAASDRLRRALNAVFVQQAALQAVVEVLDLVCADDGSAATAATTAATTGGGTGTSGSGAGASGGGGTGQTATTGSALLGLADLNGYWSSSTGKYYKVTDGAFHRHGKLVMQLSCSGTATSKWGGEGTACAGDWYNGDGTVGGQYKGLIYLTKSSRPYLEGASNYASSPDQWYEWNFGRLTDQEVADGNFASGETEAR